MYNWESLKLGISKDLKQIVNIIDPAFDIDKALNLYSKVLNFQISVPTKNDLDGLERACIEALSNQFTNGQINKSSIGEFCKNFEQFIKKIYYVLEEGEYIDSENLLDGNKIEALLPFLKSLNKVKKIYLDSKGKDVYDLELASYSTGQPVLKINTSTGGKMYKKLYPDSIKFDRYTDVNDPKINERYPNSFLAYLIKSVILKNEQSHQAPDRNSLDNVQNLYTTIITELWITDFFKKELTSIIKKDNLKNRKFDNYINSEITRLENQNSKFVSLNLKELKNRTVSDKSEFIEDLILKGFNRMRILGQGGSGKTTTLEYLLFQDAKNWKEKPLECKVPVLISLANLSFSETIIESISKKINIEQSYLEELLKTDEIKIYLDGINEIVENRESKKLKLQEISSLLDDFPTLEIVITDRYEFDSYQNNMFEIPTFMIQKLSTDKINEFVKKYCDNSEKLSAHVLTVLDSKPNIKELLLRPLVLTRAIEIIKSDNDLPEKEGQIIEKFLDSLLRREKDEKKDPLLNVNSFKLVLAFAANKIWSEHKSNAPIHEFRFNKLLVEASEEFGLEKFNAGYISRIGYELEILSKNDEYIQFFHQSYIEFFCKHYLKYELH